MTARRTFVLMTLLAICLAGCAAWAPTVLPPVLSPPPSPTHRTFRAGTGRADITPPPGLGLLGNGPEGRRATGHRHRLYARAIMLEDAAGERVALVVADLGMISPLLHRRVAALVVEFGIGADRLMLSATHTHAGPAHFLDARRMNDAGSSVTGFDPVTTRFLAERIAASIREAAHGLRPAVAGWGTADVWGFTRNRSLPAFQRNRPRPTAPVGILDPRLGAVDPEWSMLRVDYLVAGGATAPAGAFSVFAIHGTGNLAANDLYDGDIHAIVERGLERHIDTLNGDENPGGAPRAVHLFANGAEGDVSPDWPDEPEHRHAPPPRLARLRPRPPGPRVAPGPVAWRSPDRAQTAFAIRNARTFVNACGDSLAGRAIALFDSLGGALTSDIRVGRAFRTLVLTEDEALHICPDPRAGTAVLGGAEDSRTRFHNWKTLGFLDTGFEEGGAAVADHHSGCQHPKRVAAGLLGQKLAAGRHGLPETAPLQVLRIGRRLIGAVPAEATTVAGYRFKRDLADGARRGGFDPDGVTLVSLANGYIQYVATAEEYDAQHYEGGSTLYGRRTREMLGEQLADMSRRLALSGGLNEDRRITAHPGPPRIRFPRPDTPEPPSRSAPAPAFKAQEIVLRWIDARPGDLVPADGPLLRIERRVAGRWVVETWDDDRFLEVRATSRQVGAGTEWEARWRGARAGETYRAVLPERRWRDRTLPARVGEPFTAGETSAR